MILCKVEVCVLGEWVRSILLWIGMGVFGVFGSLERRIGWQYRSRTDWEVDDINKYTITDSYSYNCIPPHISYIRYSKS